MAVRALLRRMTLLDKTIVLVLLLGAAASFVSLGGDAQGERVVVEREGRVLFTAPLGENRTVSLSGPLGETVLSVHDGRAGIEAASCPNKVCMGMGKIDRAGELVACVPNELLIRIEGTSGAEEKGYDLLSH